MKIPTLALLLGMSLAIPWAQAQTEVSAAICGSLANGDNGPFDYRTERGPRLKIVEEHHFNARVEALLAGQTGTLEHDLDYMLRAFPNHHRGLIAVSRLTLRNGGLSKDPAVQRTADCYFERALRWRADDTIVRMLYAKYLHDTKRTERAVQQLDLAATQGADDAFTQHNVGLVFADIGQWDRALAQAQRAKQMGFFRPDLMDKLKAAGKWPEAAEAAASSAAAASQADAAAASAPAAAAR